MKSKPELHQKEWGQEEWIANNEDYGGKRMRIRPGFYSSYHQHIVKNETFYIEDGVLELIHKGHYFVLNKGNSFDIKALEYHSFRALEDTIFFEFSTPHSDEDVRRLTKSGNGSHEQWKKEIVEAIKYQRAIFLDRDGTINVDINYLHKIEDFKFEEGAISGLQILRGLGYKLIIVTGQSGIGWGFYEEEEYHNLMGHMYTQLEKEKIKIDGEYFCPHTQENDCNCRKPDTGMLEKAVRDFDLDLSRSWVIGDKTDDIEMGRRAGCKTILVKTGKAGRDRHYKVAPDYEARNLEVVARIIQKNEL